MTIKNNKQRYCYWQYGNRKQLIQQTERKSEFSYSSENLFAGDSENTSKGAAYVRM